MRVCIDVLMHVCMVVFIRAARERRAHEREMVCISIYMLVMHVWMGALMHVCIRMYVCVCVCMFVRMYA